MTRLRPEPRHLTLALAAFAAVTHAQQGDGGGSGMKILPRIGFSQTWTDNLRLSDQNKDAALIATVSPGISIVSNSGALRGSLDYSLNGIAYIKTSEASQLQNSLSAVGQAVIVPSTFYVDASASIGQQSASAFGLQSTPTLGSQGGVSPLVNPNRHETGVLNVAPLLRGLFGGVASFDLRGTFSITKVRDSALGDSRSIGASLLINQLTAGLLGWYVQAHTQQTQPKGSTANRSTTLTGGLNYRPDFDWVFSANAGRERTDYLGGGSNAQSGVTGGVTADWTPTPRSRVKGNWQRHRYGNSHGLALEHRLSRSVWTLSDNRSVTLGNAGSSGGMRTVYDLFFQLFASQEPDPIKRDAVVRAYLLSQGLSPDAPLSGGFLSTGPSKVHNQTLSFALQGVRSSLTGNFLRSTTSRVGDNLNQGDLASNARVEQRSYSLTASHQLTPTNAISLTASRQETAGDSAGARSQLTSLTTSWNGRLGSRLSVQLGGRHSRFEGVASYSENAVYANLTQQF